MSGPDLTGGGDAQGRAAEIHPCVNWEVWVEEREGLALGGDEGWADDNRGLRCVECAEGVYCGAGGGKKGGVDGDEILAAFQEDFDADFSDDDGDLELDEVTRVQANIRTETGMRLAVLDSAATNFWFDEETFVECSGRDLKPGTRGTKGEDGSALVVVGTGVVTFSLRGRLMRNIRVRVMRTLPSGILIERHLMLRLKMSLDFSTGVGSFSADTPRGPRILPGVFCMTAVGHWSKWRLSMRRTWRMRFAIWTCRSLATRRHRGLFARCCYATVGSIGQLEQQCNVEDKECLAFFRKLKF
jgi:hypothetical protein